MYQRRFDLLVSHLVLNDVYDYQGFLTTLGTVTKGGGRLVLSMNNPYSYIPLGRLPVTRRLSTKQVVWFVSL